MNEIICDICENKFENYNGGLPERGMGILLIGGYGLFHDDIENNCKKEVVLCHSCSLKIVRMIPKFADDKGWHSVSYKSEDFPLCCEYSWSIKKENTDSDDSSEIIYGSKENFKERK